MTRIMLLGIVLSTGIMASSASAGYVVSATQTSVLDANGVDFDYTITLTNASSSTLNLGTFWFAWVPGKDFMSNSPLTETNPNGWTSKITHGSATDGYAIQWVASNSSFVIVPGSSLSFGFESAETPTQLAGSSAAFPTFPEGTSFVYSGAPFSDAGDQFVVAPLSSVPEPSSMILTLLGGLALGLRKWFPRPAKRRSSLIS